MLVIFLITYNTYYCVSSTQTHAHAHVHTHKGVRKFNGLRLILVDLQIYIFYDFCDNCCQNN